ALLAVLGDEVEAAVDGAARLGDLDRVAEQDHFAADGPVDAEDGAGKLGAAGADQPGEAEDLAGAESEIDRLGRKGWGADILQVQRDLARRAGRRDVERF